MPWAVVRVYHSARLLACAHPSDGHAGLGQGSAGSLGGEMMARLAPAMVRACSSSRRQSSKSRSKRSDCVVAVSRASHAGLLTRSSLPRRTCPRCRSGIYMHARRRRLDRVSSPRPPSARQAPKLNKGSPLPRQRPQVCSRATTTSLAQRAWTTTTTNEKKNGDDDDNDHITNDDLIHPASPSPSRSHPTLTYYATHLVSASHPRCIARVVDTKKPTLFPLHRLARPRVTRRLHHPPSGISDRARAVGPPRAAPIARLPPVSLISQVLDLVTPYALRNLFGVVHHLLDRPAYLRVTSTESDLSFPLPNSPPSTS